MAETGWDVPALAERVKRLVKSRGTASDSSKAWIAVAGYCVHLSHMERIGMQSCVEREKCRDGLRIHVCQPPRVWQDDDVCTLGRGTQQ